MRWLALAILVGQVERSSGSCVDATLTSESGLLDSSDYASAPLEAGDSCVFRIAPAEATTSGVLLVFEALEVVTAELFVYEGSAASGTNLLWSCVSCASVLPPPLETSVASAYVTFRSPNAEFSSFRIRYVAEYADMVGRRVLNMHMAQASLRAPPTLSVRDLASMEWRIAPHDCETACDLTLMVEALNLTASDRVLVYEGATIAAGTLVASYESGQEARTSVPWVKVSGNTMVVLFETPAVSSDDDSVALLSKSAFAARFVADAQACHKGIYCDCGEAGPPTKVAMLRGATMALSDGSVSSAKMESDECKWLLEPTVLSERQSTQLLQWWPRTMWQPRLILVLSA